METSKSEISDRLSMPAESNCNEVSTKNESSTSVNYIGQVDKINGSSNIGGLDLSLMNSSPPPHSYRHSRAYRHFKNPPQPHMCIRTTTEGGEELFINVLSWTRIVIPQEPSDPIPLYGGMRVPPGSPRSPPIVFAVMANPEVLKDSGRHSKDPEERRAMIELMCDFVEAMNPGVKLVRNAIILKDRDISGELKDVWNAVQAQRDREREEQLIQQRQQQHYHNVTTQQMFPKSGESVRSIFKKTEDENQKLLIQNDISDLDKMTKSLQTSEHTQNQASVEQKDTLPDYCNAIQINDMIGNQLGANVSEFQLNGKNINVYNTQHSDPEYIDQTDASNLLLRDIEYKRKCENKNGALLTSGENYKSIIKLSPVMSIDPVVKSSLSTTIMSTSTTESIESSEPRSETEMTCSTAPPVKKDKLSGFLPNGCIFPRFKNNKHKDKEREREKEKEAKSRDKEKTLLNALKKNKDKKVGIVEQQQIKYGASAQETERKLQYEKNFINLESEVQKLSLNKIESSNNESMFIKMKLSATSTAAK